MAQGYPSPDVMDMSSMSTSELKLEAYTVTGSFPQRFVAPKIAFATKVVNITTNIFERVQWRCARSDRPARG
jgi:hypothetical protein